MKMGGKGIAETFVGGVITIGILTAVFLPGRQTIGVLKAGGSATTNVLGTAITGRK